MDKLPDTRTLMEGLKSDDFYEDEQIDVFIDEIYQLVQAAKKVKIDKVEAFAKKNFRSIAAINRSHDLIRFTKLLEKLK